MRAAHEVPFKAVEAEGRATDTLLSLGTRSRREFLAGATAVGVTLLQPGFAAAAPAGAKTFTILHTNDMHASFIGMGPSADYTPFTLNDDSTRGGYARLASLQFRDAEQPGGEQASAEQLSAAPYSGSASAPGLSVPG